MNSSIYVEESCNNHMHTHTNYIENRCSRSSCIFPEEYIEMRVWSTCLRAWVSACVCQRTRVRVIPYVATRAFILK